MLPYWAKHCEVMFAKASWELSDPKVDCAKELESRGVLMNYNYYF